MGACARACVERKRSKQNLVPRMSLDLGELKLAIIWIHTLYFFSGWSSQYLTPQKTKKNYGYYGQNVEGNMDVAKLLQNNL